MKIIIVITSLIFACLGNTRGDDILFSNLRLDGTFSDSGILIENYNSPIPIYQSVAMPFTVNATAAITSFEVALEQAPMSGVSSYALTFSVVQGSVPTGTVLESVNVTDLTEPPTLLNFTLSGTTILNEDDSYWLVAKADEGSALGWFESDSGIANSQFSANDSLWNYYGGNLSLQVNGNPIPVPEPTGLMLVPILVLLKVKKSAY